MGSKPGFETWPQHVNLAFANKYVGYNAIDKSDKIQISLEKVTAEVYLMEEIELLTADDFDKKKTKTGNPTMLTIDRIEGTMRAHGII